MNELMPATIVCPDCGREWTLHVSKSLKVISFDVECTCGTVLVFAMVRPKTVKIASFVVPRKRIKTITGASIGTALMQQIGKRFKGTPTVIAP